MTFSVAFKSTWVPTQFRIAYLVYSSSGSDSTITQVQQLVERVRPYKPTVGEPQQRYPWAGRTSCQAKVICFLVGRDYTILGCHFYTSRQVNAIQWEARSYHYYKEACTLVWRVMPKI